MIKGFFFDVGGVLIQDNSPCIKLSMQKALGVDEAALKNIWEDLVPLLGAGVIDEEVFWRKATQRFGIRSVSPSENIFGKPFEESLQPFTKVLAALREIDEKGMYKAILSNTIEPHAVILRRAGLYNDFNNVLLSHEIGLRKPNVAFFDIALQRAGIKAEELVFFDDREENIAAAKQCGMRAVLATDEDQIVCNIREILYSI